MPTFDNDLLFPPTANPAFAVDARRAAFEKLLPAIEAMGDKPLSPVVVDITTAIGVVAAAVHNVQRLLAQNGTLADITEARLEELSDCAGALAYANSLYLMATTPREPVAELSERGSDLRARLYGDVKRLVERSLVPGGELGRYVGTIGHKIIGADLQLLGDIVEHHWASVQGRTAITREEIDEAKRIGFELVTAVGIRDFAQTSVAEATRLRLHTYNLLLGRYDQLRRAISYARWDEGDGDKLAPSLYATTRGRRREPSSDLPAAANAGPGDAADGISSSPGANPRAVPSTDDAFEI